MRWPVPVRPVLWTAPSQSVGLHHPGHDRDVAGAEQRCMCPVARGVGPRRLRGRSRHPSSLVGEGFLLPRPATPARRSRQLTRGRRRRWMRIDRCPPAVTPHCRSGRTTRAARCSQASVFQAQMSPISHGCRRSLPCPGTGSLMASRSSWEPVEVRASSGASDPLNPCTSCRRPTRRRRAEADSRAPDAGLTPVVWRRGWESRGGPRLRVRVRVVISGGARSTSCHTPTMLSRSMPHCTPT